MAETIHVFLETKGRCGKIVTIVKGFTRSKDFLETLASALKKSCGVGGTLKGSTIELQGDVRQLSKSILEKQGFLVKL
jgi:translation initiation factor 1